MHPYSQQPPPSDNDRNDSGTHRGPLSRTWPQIFKKRRRYSPVRESAQQQAQQQQQQQAPQPQQILHPQTQSPYQPVQQQVQLPIHPIRPLKSPSVSALSITSPISPLRSPSIAAETASTISSISQTSLVPPKKVPISRRSSSIAPAGSNGMLHLSFQSRPIIRDPVTIHVSIDIICSY